MAQRQQQTSTKTTLTTIALVGFATLLFLASVTSAADSGLWNDETVTNSLTLDNTTRLVCVGATCDARSKLTVAGNISLQAPNGSIYRCGVSNAGAFGCAP